MKRMLKATLLRKDTMPGQENKPGLLVGFRIRGHAGFAEYGQDIVCAGASAIAQAAVLGLKDTLGSSVSFQREPGFLEVHISQESCGTASQAILRALELGLLSISREYSGYVDVTYENVV